MLVTKVSPKVPKARLPISNIRANLTHCMNPQNGVLEHIHLHSNCDRGNQAQTEQPTVYALQIH